VLSVEGRQVTIQPHHEDLNDPLPFMQHELQKAFKSSDHVKVTGGTYTGETGLVVKIDDSVIYIVSDNSMKEMKVKAKDVQLANEVATGLDSLGQFELHQLVQLDFRNVACIVRIDRDILMVLDQDGNDKQVRCCDILFDMGRRHVAYTCAHITTIALTGQAHWSPGDETMAWRNSR
jgi:transcription elongation factor SPT5